MVRYALSALVLFAITLTIFAAPVDASAAAQGTTGFSMLSNLKPLDALSLHNYAGGSGITDNTLLNVTMSGTASATSNSTNNSGTFGNSGGLSGLSVANNSGFATLIANSGNQVSISQATNINIFLH